MLSELQTTRAQKRDAVLSIKGEGITTLTELMPKANSISFLRDYNDSGGVDLDTGIVGRVMAMRIQGKLGFIDIVEEGQRIQLFFRKAQVSEAVWSVLLLLDLGDNIGAYGRLMKTRAGELSVGIKEIVLLSKSLSPLPDMHFGLTDIETRQRQRYVDLIMRPNAIKTFQTRSKIVRSIRQFMDSRGFMEVETPMFHPVSGGANARPFITHHNALNTEFNLRIAPELYLKRLIVGGFRRVFELNRNFRNEGIDRTHNPEFTMMECYEAYAGYTTAMDTVENLIRFVAKEVGVGEKFSNWSRYSMRELVQIYLGRKAESDEELMSVFENEIESTLILPTIVYDFPVSVSPLAKEKANESGWAERFELYIGGIEIANAFSELTDPEEQLIRFENQVSNHADESREVDYDYIRALSYGMPPTAGIGIGIDRLVMLMTKQESIRDVILFPTLRKESF